MFSSSKFPVCNRNDNTNYISLPRCEWEAPCGFFIVQTALFLMKCQASYTLMLPKGSNKHRDMLPCGHTRSIIRSIVRSAFCRLHIRIRYDLEG